MIYQPKDLYEMLLNDQFIINDIHTLSDEVLQIFYTDKTDSHLGSRDTNVVLGAFVTCYGRMKLYHELDAMLERILYYDTDSVIFTHEEGQYEPELADYLGKFTSELASDEHIIVMVSAGPKNYAFLTNLGNKTVKVKGMSLHFAAKNVLTFEKMVDVVKGLTTEDIMIEQLRFIKQKDKWKIRTEEIKKRYRKVYGKRILYEDFTTIPYGF
jgi:hypothetical protein